MAEMRSADVYEKLAELTEIIRRTRSDIAQIRPQEIHQDHIPKATDELDAVVAATEDATNRIMDVCDEIGVIAKEVAPEIAAKLTSSTTKIFEACNFQDITGQRIAKVIGALKDIDQKIDALMKVVGDDDTPISQTAARAANQSEDPEKALLNGPQLPKDAANQDEIDRILNGN